MKRLAFTDLLDDMDVVTGLTQATMREVASVYAPACVLYYWSDVCLHVTLGEPCWDAELEASIRRNLQSEGFRLMVVYDLPDEQD